jgi:hypothetical protein
MRMGESAWARADALEPGFALRGQPGSLPVETRRVNLSYVLYKI